MSKQEIIESLRTAHARGALPAVGYDEDLRDANLCDADLSDADLCGADLSDADMCGANLRGADLSDADLSGANLRDANLYGANLRDANLRDADLSGADLRGANLSDANLSNVNGGVLQITGLHPYQAVLVPTTQGWWLRIGCWQGTVQELRDLIVKDEGWPEATPEQVLVRRPLLSLLADMCEAHAVAHQNDLNAVTER